MALDTRRPKGYRKAWNGGGLKPQTCPPGLVAFVQLPPVQVIYCTSDGRCFAMAGDALWMISLQGEVTQVWP